MWEFIDTLQSLQVCFCFFFIADRQSCNIAFCCRERTKQEKKIGSSVSDWVIAPSDPPFITPQRSAALHYCVFSLFLFRYSRHMLPVSCSAAGREQVKGTYCRVFRELACWWRHAPGTRSSNWRTIFVIYVTCPCGLQHFTPQFSPM